MNPRKAEDIDIAAKAAFHEAQIGLEDLQLYKWETLPNDEPEPSFFNQGYFRQGVKTAVEALWRAGRLHD